MLFPEGEIALMFLKTYTGLSYDGLIEMLNGSVHMQMFCGVLLDPSNPIWEGKIVSVIRNRMAGKLDIKSLQKLLYDKWQDRIADKDQCLTDATCYESHLRFPTDIKILRECCEWLNALPGKTCWILRSAFHGTSSRTSERPALRMPGSAGIQPQLQGNSAAVF